MTVNNIVASPIDDSPEGFFVVEMDVFAVFNAFKEAESGKNWRGDWGYAFPFQYYRMHSDELRPGLHFCRRNGDHMQIIERRADGDWSGFCHNFPIEWFVA
jgi:hypothetical protein